MLKLAVAFHLACAVVTLGALVVLWTIGRKLGTIDRGATFLEDVGFAKDFQINGAVLFRGAAIVAGVLVLINTVGTLVLALLYNSLSGVLGGLVFSVLEEQSRPVASAKAGRDGRASRDGRAGQGRSRRRRPAPARTESPPLSVPTPVLPDRSFAVGPPPAASSVGSVADSDDWLAAARDGP